MKTHNVIIIGTGPAGLTAAIYTARAGYPPLVLAGLQHGGQLTTTTEIENFPGFAEPIHGAKLMQDMAKQAERVGAEIVYETVTAVDFSQRPYQVITDNQTLSAHTVIIATGATAKTLDLPGERELMGRGLSTCATCDGFFFRGKKVAVVGGGDSAMEEALYLAQLCREVVLIHRREGFRASQIMLERARKNPKITFKLPFAPVALEAQASGLAAVKLRHAETGAEERLELDGLFYGIGHEPNSRIFAPYLATDAHGYLKVQDGVLTELPGVFAAGDIADPFYKQAITAAGLGCQAAIRAAKYLESL